MMMLLACNDNGVGDNWKIPDVPNSMLYPQQRRVLARVHYFFRARSYVFKNASFFSEICQSSVYLVIMQKTSR